MEVPSPVDVHVGSKVKQRRIVLGMSQDKLAKELGLTFQQVQKYERGTNRIGASRLHDMSRILTVPVSFFFEDMNNPVGFAEQGQENFAANPLDKRETLELIRAYYRIVDPTVRKRIFDMVKAIANTTSLQTEEAG
jgi:transcriptional regulator with XRE-family HTH domain